MADNTLNFNFHYTKSFYHQCKLKCNLFVFQTVVKSICLRRTKTDQVNGRPLVSLPNKKIVVKELEFTEDERTVYAAYMDRVRTIKGSCKGGPGPESHEYFFAGA